MFVTVANFELFTLAKSMGMNIPKLRAQQGQRRQLVAVALGQEHQQMGQKDMDHVLELAQAAKVPVPQSGAHEDAALIIVIAGLDPAIHGVVTLHGWPGRARP